MTIPEPQRGELLAEIAEGFAAVADWCRASRDSPPNPERLGEALDRIEAVRDAVREMMDQEVSE